jgi:hypothetical protein
VSDKLSLRRAQGVPRSFDQAGHFGEPLRMPGHDNQQQVRQVEALEYIEQQRFFTLARACRQPDEMIAELRAQARARGDRYPTASIDIELEIAGDPRRIAPNRTKRAASFAVCAANPLSERKSGDQSAEARIAARGAFGQPRIDQKQRDGLCLQAANRFGHNSVSMITPMSGRARRRNSQTSGGNRRANRLARIPEGSGRRTATARYRVR